MNDGLHVRARAFWTWFEAAVLPSLADDDGPDAALIQELDARMQALGVSWELGPAPDDHEGWALAVSFNADPGRLPRADVVVSVAPELPGCRVLLGKPPKVWDGTLDLRGGAVRVATHDWRCVVWRGSAGLVIAVAPKGADVEVEVSQRAVEIAVMSELGELCVAQAIESVVAVDPSLLDSLLGATCEVRGLRAAVAAQMRKDEA